MKKNNKPKNLKTAKKYVGLFIHIPFYTDVIDNNKENNLKQKNYNNYINALILELKSYAQKLQNHIITSIFIGGGAEEFAVYSNESFENAALQFNSTPLNNGQKTKANKIKNEKNEKNKIKVNNSTIIENKTYNNSLKQVISVVKQLFKLQKDAEITIETNSYNITPQTAKTFKLCGVNRVSLVLNNMPKRLQKMVFKQNKKAVIKEYSANNNNTSLVNDSIHNNANNFYNSKVFSKAVSVLKENEIANINADLIIGFPYQKNHNNKKIIKQIFKQNLTHVSLYEFVLTDHNQINSLFENNKISLLNDSKAINLFNKSANLLQKNAYNRYEISNFSREKYKSKHSLGLWNMQEFLGVGAGAYSFLSNTRFNNFSGVLNYIKAINSENTAIENLRELTKQELFEDAVMLGLQTVKGVNLNDLTTNYNVNLLKQKESKINEFINLGYLKLSNIYLSLTQEGFLVANKIILELVF